MAELTCHEQIAPRMYGAREERQESLAQRKLGQRMAAFIQEGMRGTGGSKADPPVSEKPTN
jgi:hypothetical protein